MKKLLSISLLALGFAVGTAQAHSVTWPIGQANGSFSCTGSDTSATVSMDTGQVLATGFCSGAPYVTSDGHIANFPVSWLNTYYFKITKNPGDNGWVDVTPSAGTVVTCTADSGSGRIAYPYGQYCLTGPTK
jgi:hypothetical protein